MKLSFRNRAAATAILATTIVPAALADRNNDWTGAVNNDWNNAGNWSLGHLPDTTQGDVNEDANIFTSTGNIATIFADVPVSPRDTKVGMGGGSNGRVDHRAGTYSQGATNWTFIGTAGGSGTYNLADTATSGGALTNFGTGTGTFNAGRRFLVGGHFDSPGIQGTVNINTTGSLNIATIPENDDDGLYLGMGSTGIMNLDNGTVAMRQSRIGVQTPNGVGNPQVGGTGILNVSGGTINNARFMMIGLENAKGTVNQTGGVVNVSSGWFGVGYGGVGPQDSSYNISGGQLNMEAIAEIGADRGGAMTINGTGTVTKTGNSDFVVGLRGGGNGTLNIGPGGTLNLENTDRLTIGEQNNATGTVTMTGGTVNDTGEATELNIGRNGGSTGFFNLSGGTYNAGTTNVGDSGTGTLNLSGTGALNVAGDMRVGNVNNAVGTLSVTGGTLNVSADLNIALANNAKGTVTVGNGGTINARAVRVGWGTSGPTATTAGEMIVNAGGTVNVDNDANDNFQIGDNNGTGKLTVNGGLVDIKDGGNLVMGWGGTGSGTVEQNGGTLNVTGNFVVNRESSGTQVVNVAGGNLNAGSILFGANAGATGASSINQTGGTVTVAGSLDLQGNGTAGTYALNGGSLLVGGAIEAATGTFNFGAGKLSRPNAGIITVNGSLMTQSAGSTLDLDGDKTFQINGDFNNIAGLSLELDGRGIPDQGAPFLNPVTGSFTLGNITGAITLGGDAFDIAATSVLGFDNVFNVGGQGDFTAMRIDEGAAFNPQTQSVYWLDQDPGGLGGTDVILKYSVIPEPATAGMLGLAGVLLAVRRRRRL